MVTWGIGCIITYGIHHYLDKYEYRLSENNSITDIVCGNDNIINITDTIPSVAFELDIAPSVRLTDYLPIYSLCDIK